MRFLLLSLVLCASPLTLTAAPVVKSCPNGQCSNQSLQPRPTDYRLPAPTPAIQQSLALPLPTPITPQIVATEGIPEKDAQPNGVYWRLPNGNLSTCPPSQAHPTSIGVPSVTTHERGFSLSIGIGFSRVVELHNAERRARGLLPLTVDPGLTASAQQQANAQAASGKMGHSTRLAPGTAENVAAGQTSEEQVSQSWMNSPRHRDNVLNPGYTRIGVARVGGFWVAQFSR